MRGRQVMILNVLAVGDVVGDSGVEYLSRHLRGLKKLKGVHFTVVNGENASGVGILPRQAREIFDAGADVVTLGNHTWNRIQIADFLEDDRYTLRPANYTSRVPGRVRIGVMNLIGRCEMDSNFDNPFTTADRVLRRMEGTDVVLVDFHAEATSEKGAMGYYLDGRAQAVWGTHTHVPTADEQIYPKGTGYITDIGMTGPIVSVLGVRVEQSIAMFRGDLTEYFKTAEGDCAVSGALFDITRNGKCNSVTRVWERWNVR